MTKVLFSPKKRIVIFAGVLALAGAFLLLVGYFENIVGATQLRIDMLRLLVILMVAAFAAMGGVSIARFEHEEPQVQQ